MKVDSMLHCRLLVDPLPPKQNRTFKAHETAAKSGGGPLFCHSCIVTQEALHPSVRV